MAYPAARTTARTRPGGFAVRPAGAGGRTPGTRHPLVAAAMVLPLAVLLAVVFGGVDAVLDHASSVAGMLER
ncbi:hypothetical protein V1J52_13105 [Streptomyces sp. TRM 70351]|uniref:hypothetical protein n=1 Tax=Streptomyces sp. TRM 70351 TaxID=3116552 RepID=UPI002E7C30F1|nr:hypothetical protein [Streptomyces sp. TRM 70351]MEE1929101.1 hypothetical protein [Streptomyces sp. TRM 70351]